MTRSIPQMMRHVIPSLLIAIPLVRAFSATQSLLVLPCQDTHYVCAYKRGVCAYPACVTYIVDDHDGELCDAVCSPACGFSCW
jgi:hypothetical protein